MAAPTLTLNPALTLAPALSPTRLINKLQPGSVQKVNEPIQNWHKVRGPRMGGSGIGGLQGARVPTAGQGVRAPS